MTETQSPPAPDQAQRERALTILDRNLVVEAAAGSGKTTVLVERMLRLLEGGHCTPGSLVAVTFTRKAAAELRFRIHARLDQRRLEDLDLAARERLNEAAAHMGRLFIGTIHSFCASILRDRSMEAGLSPECRELDEDEDRALCYALWDEFVAELYARDDPALERLARVGLGPAQLAAAFERFSRYPDVANWPCSPAPPIDADALRRDLAAEVEHMKAVVNEVSHHRIRDELLKKYRRLPRLAAVHDLNRMEELMEALEEFKPMDESKLKKGDWPGKDNAERKKHWEPELNRWNNFCNGMATPALAAWKVARYPVVIEVLAEAARFAEKRRRAQDVLNYQDLLMGAARLLRENPDIRQVLARRYTHLLVDEFQDTDPIQAEVLFLLSGERAEERQWQQAKPRPGSLFVVGDPQQSIYRFRRADLQTFEQVKSILTTEGGEVVTLTANFRAQPVLIDWVNRAFSELFPPEPNAGAVQYQPMMPGLSQSLPDQACGARTIEVPADLKLTVDQTAHSEAERVACVIRQALDQGWLVPSGKHREETRPLRPSDVLILTRVRKRLNSYADALRRWEIPCQVTGGNELVESEELQDLYRFLRSAHRLEDPVALLAVLRGRWFGFSDQELYAYRQSGGYFRWAHGVPTTLPAELANRFQSAFALLRMANVWLSRLPILATLERIMTSLGASMQAAIRGQQDQMFRCLVKAREVLRSQSVFSTDEALETLRSLGDRDGKHDGARLPESDLSAVRVMNVHQAKGLEAAVVFLVDVSGTANDHVEIHIERQPSRTLGFMPIEAPRRGYQPGSLLALPSVWAQMDARERRLLAAEETRLIYVAATRAAQLLVVCVHEDAAKNQGSPWGALAPFLGKVPRLDGLEFQRNLSKEVQLDQAADPGAAERLQRWDAIRRPSYQRRTVGEHPPFVCEPVAVVSRERGEAWGRLIHQLLESALRKPPEARLQDLAELMVRQQGLDSQWTADAMHLVHRVRCSDLWKRARAAAWSAAEVPVWGAEKRRRQDDPVPPTTLVGTIDLVFKEPEGWVIVDYKTETPKQTGDLNTLVDRYRAQLRGYADVWEQVVHEPIHQRLLFFVGMDRIVEV